jgi:NDP-sugar pyrophosphorylase family protein
VGIERDPVEFRGTGGVLRDLSQEYDDNQYLLVAHANQLLLRPMTWCVERLLETQGEVRVLAGPRQVPGGMFLFKCGCLRGISKSGYVDMKEQAIPSIAAKYRAQVVLADQMPCHSIRRWKDYLSCVRSQQANGQAQGQEDVLQREDWQPLFRLTEKGANVSASANVHDSVVLAGGQVQDGATVVRSLIGPGGVVRRGEVVVDRLVTANGNIE